MGETLVGEVDYGGGYACLVGHRGSMGKSIPSAHFCSEPKTGLKK